jgi:LSD1 subclass zinc finger protein
MLLRRRESSRTLRCAYCHGALDARRVVCSGCRTLLHVECVALLVACPTLGCSRRFGEPPTPPSWRHVALAAAALLLVLVPLGVGFSVGTEVTSELVSFVPPGPDPSVESAPSSVERGLAREVEGDLAGAVVEYTAGIERDPRNDSLRERRATVRLLLGDADGARADWCQAVAAFPVARDETDWGRWNGRGYYRGRIGDYFGALGDCTRAIELAPNEAYPWNNRAWARLHLGDLAGAWADVEKSLELDPRNAYAWETRARIELARGEVARARADFQRSLSVDVSRHRIATVKRALADLERAEEGRR